MAIKIKLRRDTSLNWQTNNPILDEGEPGFETDTLRFKVGNGSANWNSLNYVKFAGFINDIEGLDTANVEENVNLYFTNSRVYANVAPMLVQYTSNAYLANALSVKANLAGLNTSLIEENGNLYFTNARVYSNVVNMGFTSNAYLANALALKPNTADLNTTVINEGINLYFTNTRAVNSLTVSDKLILQANGYMTVAVENILPAGNVFSVNGLTGVVTLTTLDVSEDTNLYFTNTRTYSNVVNISKFGSDAANLELQANGASGTYVSIVNAPLKVASFTYDLIVSQLIGEPGHIVFDTSNSVFRGFNGTNWTILG